MSEKETRNEKQEKIIEQHKEAKIVRRIVLVITLILLIVIAGVIGGGYVYIKSALQPVDPENKETVNITIPIGSSSTAIANILEENGLIKDAKIFRYYIKFKNESGFQAGDYELSQSMTFQELIDSIKTGVVIQDVVFKVTIPEGKQLSQIGKIIAEKTNYSEDEVMAKLTDKEYIATLQSRYPDLLTEEILGENIKYPLEGYLFPATYDFYKEDPSIEDIVEKMLAKTQEVLLTYDAEIAGLGMSAHTVLTMASLIEEEATAKTDREQISSVFYNRMDIGMPLQTDPTVLYALGKHKERVLYEDLEVNSPYNTYMHAGLPPGPIANAGEMSIIAALNPASTDYLYFLAAPSGDVFYAKTLEEHNALKAQYITND
ncbi:endolytic transglycosylase MltG [Cytobacillus sp. IB215665]|uniref:endolytic transglycosylase MltG n=1 Tax=Cytobacillus sp. IB215665 TaxID=3097357 RepID=UPI002A14580A|nr:endolytic transglycosylase MltG [Cytobacillus sp. IB215665]MDX8364113.1 endolytic transglycosylase MltG [Cytobacillus sp. IB215665]